MFVYELSGCGFKSSCSHYNGLVLLNLFLLSDSSIFCIVAFPLFGNSNHVVSFSIDLPSNPMGDAPFQCTAFASSHSD